MIYFKKIIFITSIVFFWINAANAEIKDRLFATVGTKAITQSDIINEIKTILILSGQSFSEDKKDQLQTAAIQSTIKRNIKKIEIEKHKNLQFNPADINLELQKLASNVDMDLDSLENTFVTNGIDFSNIIEQIQIELMWNSLIFKIYKDSLFVNQEEIEEQMRLLEGKKEIEEYLISEIIIKPVPEDKLQDEIKKISEKIENEGFEKVAINLSISESALKGGNLGWISENVISDQFKNKIIKTPIGGISEPIVLPDGILLFKVRDKRKLKKKINLDEIKNQLVRAEKNKILSMHSLSHYDKLRRSITINYIK